MGETEEVQKFSAVTEGSRDGQSAASLELPKRVRVSELLPLGFIL